MRKLLFSAIALLFFSGSLGAFELKTRIYPADIRVTLRIKAVSKWAKKWLVKAAAMQKEGKAVFKAGKEYPLVGYWREDRRHSRSDAFVRAGYPEPLDFRIEGNDVVLDVDLRGEEFHTISFFDLPNYRKFRIIKVMTLNKDDFKLRPFKGNLHQHSTASDGKFSPEEHVGYARIAGFDFVGISDHREYKQNAPAIKTAADCQSGLTVYPAEELHTADGTLHGLSIGGTKKHSSLRGRSKAQALRNMVKPFYDELAVKFPAMEHDQLFIWAESLMLARRAKADGALVVYCHPAWRLRFFLNNTREMIKFMMRCPEFDVIEIINGSMVTRDSSRRENMESIAIYNEICAELGVVKPVMSSSDSHNVSRSDYRRSYNVMFAPDTSFPAFKAAFIGGRTVAVSDIGESAQKPCPQNFGRSKYVRYANFLDEIGYWKKHDSYAGKQGELILKYLKGDKSQVSEIAKLAGLIIRHREEMYYQPAR